MSVRLSQNRSEQHDKKKLRIMIACLCLIVLIDGRSFRNKFLHIWNIAFECSFAHQRHELILNSLYLQKNCRSSERPSFSNDMGKGMILNCKLTVPKTGLRSSTFRRFEDSQHPILPFAQEPPKKSSESLL